jgi:hypothetical protein
MQAERSNLILEEDSERGKPTTGIGLLAGADQVNSLGRPIGRGSLANQDSKSIGAEFTVRIDDNNYGRRVSGKVCQAMIERKALASTLCIGALDCLDPGFTSGHRGAVRAIVGNNEDSVARQHLPADISHGRDDPGFFVVGRDQDGTRRPMASRIFAATRNKRGQCLNGQCAERDRNQDRDRKQYPVA